MYPAVTKSYLLQRLPIPRFQEGSKNSKSGHATRRKKPRKNVVWAMKSDYGVGMFNERLVYAARFYFKGSRSSVWSLSAQLKNTGGSQATWKFGFD